MKKIKIIAFVIFLASNLHAQDEQNKQDFSLVDAEGYAVENNYQIKNVQLDYEASEKKIWETIAIGLPQVNAEGNFQDLIDIPVSVVDATLFNPLAPPGSVMEFQMGQKYSMSATINVNQLIFDGSYIVGLQFSKFYQEMAKTNIDRTITQVKVTVREAYYNTLVAEKNLELIDSIVLSTKLMWDQSKVFYESGFILKEDLDQIEVSYNRIQVSQKNATNQVVIAKNLLKLQMGYDLESEIILNESFDDVLEGILQNNPALKEFSVENNYDYIMMSQQKQLDEYSLKNEKAKYLPSVGAFFSHSQNAFRQEFDFFDGDGAWYPTTVWGVGVQVPILSSGQKLMKVQQAKIKIEQDDNQLTNVENSLKFRELQLKASFMNAYEALELEKKNVELAQSIYNNALKRKSEGAINALDVTQIQNQLLQAEGSYINAIMQMLMYKIELDKLYNN
jgi:outer membrane protein TolC